MYNSAILILSKSNHPDVGEEEGQVESHEQVRPLFQAKSTCLDWELPQGAWFPGPLGRNLMCRDQCFCYSVAPKYMAATSPGISAEEMALFQVLGTACSIVPQCSTFWGDLQGSVYRYRIFALNSDIEDVTLLYTCIHFLSLLWQITTNLVA